MIEAVNSYVQTAPLARVSAEQVSSSNSYSVNPNQVQKASQVPYVSPYYTVDSSDNQIVMEIRNPSTGAILQSYPTETQIQDRQAQAQQDAAARSSYHQEDEEDGDTQSPQLTASVSSGYSGGSSGQTRSPATNRQIAAFTAASLAGQQGQDSGSGSGSGGVSLVA